MPHLVIIIFLSSIWEILSGIFMLQHCIDSRITSAIVSVDTDKRSRKTQHKISLNPMSGWHQGVIRIWADTN